MRLPALSSASYLAQYRKWGKAFIPVIAAAVAASVAVVIREEDEGNSEPPSKKRRPNCVRYRRTVFDMHRCAGPDGFRRAYRMSYESFWILHDKLEDGIHSAVYAVRGKPMPSTDDGGREGGNYSAPPTPNWPILISTRLAVALRFFAGHLTMI